MKANELMIGDWVRTEAGALIVAGVGHKIYCRANDGNPTHSWEVTSIEPIPLTPKILEKNGFNDDCAGTYGNDDAYFIPTYRGSDAGTWETHIEPTEGVGDFSGKLRYVHELQHALRLCGIDKEIEL